MPELPEVETIVREFRPRLVGRTIRSFRSLWPDQVQPDPAAVQRAVAGRRITDLHRRGKLAVLELEGGLALLIHFKMSGRLEWGTCAGGDPPRHVRAVWSLDGGERLQLCDARRFGRIRLSADWRRDTVHLGPEPLSDGFTARILTERLRGRRRALKPLLLDQTVVAGLGNIYVDEALHRAGLHPERPAGGLTEPEIRRLHRGIRAVLREAVAHHGTSIDWAYPGGSMQERLRAYGRAGQPCPRCGTPITKSRVGQRGTHHCPDCQT